jgi:hypothetical protein
MKDRVMSDKLETGETEHDNVVHAMQPEDTPELRALYKGLRLNI